MKKFLLITGMSTIVAFNNVSCQSKNNSFTLSTEVIKSKNAKIFNLIKNDKLSFKGKKDNEFILQGVDSIKNQVTFLYNEGKQELKPYYKIINQRGNKAINMLFLNDKVLKVGFYDVQEQYVKMPIDEMPIDLFGYQDFWIQYKDVNIKIDSFPYHYLDKYINCKFSEDGEKLLCNPYTTVSAGYSQDIDNRIYVYNLKGIEKRRIVKQEILCERCFNTLLINDMYFYGKEISIGHGYDGYYLNIYKAPSSNINDTIQIAHDIELIILSPDGRFILGKKYIYGKYTPVIINVETKKYQYILGRDYSFDYCYYSFDEGKFAFDFGSKIVYIEFPKEYPFNALENYAFNRGSKADNKAFWDKYKHKPLN